MAIDDSDVVSIIGILALTSFGVLYIKTAPRVDPGVVMAVVVGIAGLGGYQIRRRYDSLAARWEDEE